MSDATNGVVRPSWLREAVWRHIQSKMAPDHVKHCDDNDTLIDHLSVETNQLDNNDLLDAIAGALSERYGDGVSQISVGPSLSEAQIKHMVGRFLGWRLPEDFNPDAGISFKADYNENTPWPMKHEPVGTNLFTATQADAMIRYMVEGLPDNGT